MEPAAGSETPQASQPARLQEETQGETRGQTRGCRLLRARGMDAHGWRHPRLGQQLPGWLAGGVRGSRCGWGLRAVTHHTLPPARVCTRAELPVPGWHCASVV